MARWLWLACVVALCTMPVRAASDVIAATGAAPAITAGMVAQLALEGPIGPAAAEYFDDDSRRAVDDGAVAIVLRLDTPGGLEDSMRQIIANMLACKLPILVYVAPGGARAASAGTYILYAGQVAAMAPATHLGAATPVSLSGNTSMPDAGELPASAKSSGQPAASHNAADTSRDAESHKVLNDSIAYIRSLAQLRGRNAAWAEQAVRGAATLTASEAAKEHVIDFVATDTPDLLAKADGLQVQVGDHSVTLQLKGHSVREYAPNARTRFLAIITNPTIAYVLLLAGMFGLVLEAMHPGVIPPGVVGGICLLIGLYALQLLPVNYAGLALMALGVCLLVAEVVNPTVGVLGIGGVISFVMGSVMLMNTGVEGYGVNLGVIAGIAVCAALSLALILWLVMRSRRSQAVTGDIAMRTDIAELLEPVNAGGEAWVMVRGERWRVHCDASLPAGAQVRIVRRQGLLLWVVPV